jgi:hypothetical protein
MSVTCVIVRIIDSCCSHVPSTKGFIDSGERQTRSSMDYWFRWLACPIVRIIDSDDLHMRSSKDYWFIHDQYVADTLSFLYPDFYDLNYTCFVKICYIRWPFRFISFSLWEIIWVFWDVTPRRLVTRCFETSVNVDHPTGCDPAAGLNLNS